MIARITADATEHAVNGDNPSPLQRFHDTDGFVGAGSEPAPTNGARARSHCYTRDAANEEPVKGHVLSHVPEIVFQI